MKTQMSTWMRRGTPWVWLNAGAVAISILMVVGLLALLTVRGMSHFWPRDVMQADYAPPTSSGELLSTQVIGEFVESEMVLSAQIASSGIPVDEAQGFYERQLVKLGNRDLTGADFTWVLSDYVHNVEYPENVVALERREWGNFYGHLSGINENADLIAFSGDVSAIESSRWNDFNERLERALDIREDIYVIENQEIGQINYAMERLRLRERRLELDQELTPEALDRKSTV